MAMRAVTVRDNGHGIPHDEVEALFGKLGGSWKRHGSRSKAKGRLLHGKEGKGRLKALALGRSAVWSVRYLKGTKLMAYTISLLRDDLVDVRVTEPVEAEPALGTGVEVKITEIDRTYRSLEPNRSVQALSEVFALYLTDYSDVGVYVETERLDGLTNDQVVAGVMDVFPDASTTKRSVAWYRSDMKKRGLPVLSQVEAKRRQAAKDKKSP